MIWEPWAGSAARRPIGIVLFGVAILELVELVVYLMKNVLPRIVAAQAEHLASAAGVSSISSILTLLDTGLRLGVYTIGVGGHRCR